MSSFGNSLLKNCRASINYRRSSRWPRSSLFIYRKPAPSPQPFIPKSTICGPKARLWALYGPRIVLPRQCHCLPQLAASLSPAPGWGSSHQLGSVVVHPQFHLFYSLFCPCLFVPEDLDSSVLLFYDPWLWRWEHKRGWTAVFRVLSALASPAWLSAAPSSFPSSCGFHRLQMLAQLGKKPRCPSMVRSIENVFLGLLGHFLSTVFSLCAWLCSSWASCAWGSEHEQRGALSVRKDAVGSHSGWRGLCFQIITELKFM